MNTLLDNIGKTLIAGNESEVKRLAQEGLNQGITARKIIDDGLLVGMDIIGKRFKCGDMFIPEVLLCARCMHGGMEVLSPHLASGESDNAGTFVIGTVQGDLHDIGKNLVAMMLKGVGFKVIDLGTDISPEAFVAAVREHKPDILGLSALLTTTMPKMQETINALKEAGIRDQIKIMAGGAPVTQAFVEIIGADAYGANAAAAAEKAKEFMAGR